MCETPPLCCKRLPRKHRNSLEPLCDGMSCRYSRQAGCNRAKRRWHLESSPTNWLPGVRLDSPQNGATGEGKASRAQEKSSALHWTSLGGGGGLGTATPLCCGRVGGGKLHPHTALRGPVPRPPSTPALTGAACSCGPRSSPTRPGWTRQRAAGLGSSRVLGRGH